MTNNSEMIAKAALDINAIIIRPSDPFTWASGYRMPIYNDDRLFLGYPHHRKMIAKQFYQIMIENGIDYEVIAGTSTAGIPHATTLADMLSVPMVYVRDKPKEHGLRNQIEGIDANSNLDGRDVVLIEDLISTGGSSVKAVQAIRNAKGHCNYCLSIFNYGFDKAFDMFAGSEPFDQDGRSLTSRCSVRSLLTYDVLLKVAKETGYISPDQVKILKEWRENPFGWGEKHGFPKIEK